VAVIERNARARKLRGLYAVTPDEADTARLVAKVEAALAGGASAIQYRNKTGDDVLRAEQASALARLTRRYGALYIVNDDAGLARDVGADGVHIGEDDGDIAAARAMVGDAAVVGVSCYDALDRARRVVPQGADYIAFGSFFASRVKPGARHADVALIPVAKGLGVPVVAIGGITADNASMLVTAGVDAVAVISDVFAHDDPAAITRAAAAIVACFSGVDP
jgi:thiamine-phosphate pyrophosphorylase